MLSFFPPEIICIIAKYAPTEVFEHIEKHALSYNCKSLYQSFFKESEVKVVYTYPKLFENSYLNGLKNYLNWKYQRIAQSCNFTVILLNDGTLMGNNVVFGEEPNKKNDVYLTGLGEGESNEEYKKIPMEKYLLPDEKIISISCGKGHLLLLLNNGAVLCVGDNQYGQLGLGDKVNKNKPQRITTDYYIVSIACYSNHSILLTNSGEVLSCGSNNYGQLGFSSLDYYSLNLQKIPTDQKIVSIGTGVLHSMFLTVTGEILAVGSNKSGQCGLGWEIILPLTKVPILKNVLQTQGGRTKVLQTQGGRTKVLQIACGAFHTIIKLEDGTIFGTGWNRNGQLGLRHLTIIDQFTPIEVKSNRIIDISCGADSTILLSKGNKKEKLYVSGFDYRGNKKNKFSKTRVSHNKKGNLIVGIASFANKTLLLTKNNEFYESEAGATFNRRNFDTNMITYNYTSESESSSSEDLSSDAEIEADSSEDWDTNDKDSKEFKENRMKKQKQKMEQKIRVKYL